MKTQQVITNQTIDQVKDYITLAITMIKPDTVQGLIQHIQQRFALSSEEITLILLQLESENKISFAKKKFNALPVALKSYIFSSSATWYWLTLVIASLTLLAVFVIPKTVYPLTYLRQVMGTLFVGYLPGFTLLKMLYPKKESVDMSSKRADALERIVLSVSLSIVLVAVDGLIFNYTPFGIRLVPITLTLFLFTFIFALVGVIRSYREQISPNKKIFA
ncbi:MAG: DUF1616 domain-containing protein [Candidatus Bathyarchaeia archaeon]|jgi:small-conductance mechanosensitive channel